MKPLRLIAITPVLGIDMAPEKTGAMIVADFAETQALRVHRMNLPAEVVEITRRVVAATREAVAAGEFPVVIAGNCVTCLGAMAAIGTRRGGAVWLDAHGDFNTPETSPSGMIDGMPLAIATGRCHGSIWGETGRVPLRDAAVVLVGVRETDPAEQRALEASRVTVITAADIRAAGSPATLQARLERLCGNAESAYIHLDLDGIDPAEAGGVGYPTPGGIGERSVAGLIDAVFESIHVAAAGIAGYDPRFDGDGATLELVGRLLQQLAERASTQEG